MKKILILMGILCLGSSAFSQTDPQTKSDTLIVKRAPEADTITIGGMIIIRNKKDSSYTRKTENENTQNRKPKNVKTNWMVMDLGFSNYDDNTNYAAAQADGFVNASITNSDALKVNTGKSMNINLWFFMQKVSLANRYLNLKYGLGMEMNNFKFSDKRVRFSDNPTRIDMGYSGLTKNKLFTNYLTVPLMLNVNFTPNKKMALGFSAGASAGYLIGSRQKTKIDGDVNKLRDDFNLDKWKISYQAELGLGPVKLYGSLATKSMFEKSLDITPYTIGFRLSSF